MNFVGVILQYISINSGLLGDRHGTPFLFFPNPEWWSWEVLDLLFPILSPKAKKKVKTQNKAKQNKKAGTHKHRETCITAPWEGQSCPHSRRSPASTLRDKAGTQVGRRSQSPDAPEVLLQPRVCYLWLEGLLKPDFLVATADIVYSNWEAVHPPGQRVQELHLRRGYPQLHLLLWGLHLPGDQGAPLSLHGGPLGGLQTVADLTYSGPAWTPSLGNRQTPRARLKLHPHWCSPNFVRWLSRTENAGFWRKNTGIAGVTRDAGNVLWQPRSQRHLTLSWPGRILRSHCGVGIFWTSLKTKLKERGKWCAHGVY